MILLTSTFYILMQYAIQALQGMTVLNKVTSDIIYLLLVRPYESSISL